VQPVPSSFGEPVLTPAQIEARDAHRWVICGGTALIEKSARSFRDILSRAPEHFAPRELFVFGGSENPVVRSILNDLRDVKWSYQPQIDAPIASEILAHSAFGWLDYFHHPSAPVDALFKSSVFAALCAHGVIPVLPHQTQPLVLGAESLPRLCFVDQAKTQLPSQNERAGVGLQFYDYYHRRASLKQLTRVIGEALEVERASAATSWT
jgi:hypothetical protein